MSRHFTTAHSRRLRIGAVTYLNAKPLTISLPHFIPKADIVIDYPSRLADGLRAGELDVAMIPSIEYARQPNCTIVSNACIASNGPVRSVKLYSRVPVERITSLAMDAGSRTSATLARILLKERYDINPAICSLAMGASVDDVWADAIMLIGDRGMLPAEGPFEFVWDLGEQWTHWTGLPFVFAMWIARPGLSLPDLPNLLAEARDDGLTRLEEIAKRESPILGIAEVDCLSYLRDTLKFHLGEKERNAVERFYELAGRQDLAPSGVKLAFHSN
jgi:chorismate dehydratase